MRVFVINKGICSAIGMSVKENYDKLCAHQTGIKKIDLVQHLDRPFIGGEISLTNDGLKSKLTVAKENNIPRTSLIGLHAVKEAMSGFERWSEQTQLFSATTVGGMDLSEDFYRDYLLQQKEEGMDVLSMHDCGASSFWMAQQMNSRKVPFTISSACSSAANAIMLAGESIKTGRNEIALAGGTDALSRFTINGFNALMIYDETLCKPFDINRKGLNLGEGAGYLLLASESFVKEHNITPIAEYLGGANTNDAYHQTASSPEAKGAKLAMTQAMERAGITPEHVDYINAHGTATENNDNTEQKAFEDLMPKDIAFSSTKGFTGHTLAAAGGIEAVFSCLALEHQKVFGNIHCEAPINEFVQPISETKDFDVNYVVSNSFGFGGNSTTLIFGKA